MKVTDSFGNWLRQRRKALDLTQFDLAEQVGCSVVTIRKIEANERRPSKQITERLADVLAISDDERAIFVAFARHTEDIPSALRLPKAAAGSIPHNLPSQLTSFVGREDELVQIAERLNNPACRLLTLVGTGGIGKTRLALQAAAEQIANFANGVYFVSLTGVGAPNLVASAIAGALTVSFYGSDSPDVQIVNYLRHKTMLLVLDNFEHLLEATRLLTDILATAPGVKLLITSRERLNLQEEWVIAVEGLAFPPALTLNPSPKWRGTSQAIRSSPLGEGQGVRAGLDDYSAVQLFVQRARQVQAIFSLEQNSEAVLAICRSVEGMPLGLELAASWLRVMTCPQIADQLEHSLDFLTTSARNAPERHRSIRAVFDHSWTLLTSDEQAVFSKLAVFRGGFEREAAKQVANATLGILTALIDKSLLRNNPTGRYDLHELVRQYAERQLEASHTLTSTQAAHSGYYMEFLAQRDADVKGRRQMAALHEIRTDFDNIRAAWQWASEHRQYEAVSRAVNCLLNFAEMCFRLPDVLAFLRQTDALWAPNDDQKPNPAWDKIVVRREWVELRVAGLDHPLSEIILRRALERGDREEIAWCRWVLADLLFDTTVIPFAEENIMLRRALGDDFYTAHALLGSAAYNIYFNGQLERGLEHLRESIVMRERLGDKFGLGMSFWLTGFGLFYHARLGEAETSFDAANALYNEIGQGQPYSTMMSYEAAIAFWAGKFEIADQIAQLGVDVAPDHEFLDSKSTSLAVLGYLANIDENYPLGRALSEQAKAGAWGDRVVWGYWGLALAYCGLGDDTQARQCLQSVLHHATYTPIFQWLYMPPAAVLSVRNGDSQRAVELLGLFSTAPHELTGWADKWPLLTRLRADLEAELGVERYAAAWAKGRALKLEQVVDEALEKPPDPTIFVTR